VELVGFTDDWHEGEKTFRAWGGEMGGGLSTSIVRCRWLALYGWIARIGSEATRTALLPAGPVPERSNVKSVFIETPDCQRLDDEPFGDFSI